MQENLFLLDSITKKPSNDIEFYISRNTLQRCLGSSFFHKETDKLLSMPEFKGTVDLYSIVVRDLNIVFLL